MSVITAWMVGSTSSVRQPASPSASSRTSKRSRTCRMMDA